MLYFIVNPNAGGVNGYKVWKRLERRLIRKKTEYQVVLTGGRGEKVGSERLSAAAPAYSPRAPF